MARVKVRTGERNPQIAAVRMRQLQYAEADTRPAHSVVVHLKLSADWCESDPEITALEDLQRRVQAIVEVTGTGKYDRDEVGEDTYDLFLHGAQADELFGAMLPVLMEYEPLPGSFAVKQYGPKGSWQQVVQLSSRRA